MNRKDITSFYPVFIPPLFAHSIASPVSRDLSSVLNFSSKPSTPTSPSHHWFYELNVLCLVLMFPFQSKVEHKHQPSTPAEVFYPSSPRVEQKVAVISSPLWHSGRIGAAPSLCNSLFSEGAEHNEVLTGQTPTQKKSNTAAVSPCDGGAENGGPEFPASAVMCFIPLHLT